MSLEYWLPDSSYWENVSTLGLKMLNSCKFLYFRPSWKLLCGGTRPKGKMLSMASSAVCGAQLYELVTDIILRLYSNDVKVHLLICDQGSTNKTLAGKLNVTIDKPWFQLNLSDNTQITVYGKTVFFYATPHVMRSYKLVDLIDLMLLIVHNQTCLIG